MRSRRGTKVPPSGDGGAAAYQALFAQKIAIEAEFGEPLIWEERANTKRSLIYIQPFPVDFGNPAIFQQAHEWMLRRMSVPGAGNQQALTRKGISVGRGFSIGCTKSHSK
jgi:hypothetical protein